MSDPSPVVVIPDDCHESPQPGEETNRGLDSMEAAIVKLSKAFSEIIAHQDQSTNNQNTILATLNGMKTNLKSTQHKPPTDECVKEKKDS